MDWGDGIRRGDENGDEEWMSFGIAVVGDVLRLRTMFASICCIVDRRVVRESLSDVVSSSTSPSVLA